MADAATLVMFDVYSGAFKYAAVLRGGDDYEVLAAGGEKSEHTHDLFRSRVQEAMIRSDNSPTFEQLAKLMLYNMSMLGDMKSFDSPDEALRFAQEISAESPAADDYGKRQ